MSGWRGLFFLCDPLQTSPYSGFGLGMMYVKNSHFDHFSGHNPARRPVYILNLDHPAYRYQGWGCLHPLAILSCFRWVFSSHLPDYCTFPSIPLFTGTRLVFPPCKYFHTFDILGHLVKKLSLRFWKDGLVTKLPRATCKEGLFLEHTYEVTLKHWLYNMVPGAVWIRDPSKMFKFLLELIICVKFIMLLEFLCILPVQMWILGF